MNYVTVEMICAHTGKHRNTVANWIKATGTAAERFPGVHGLRIPLREANKMIAKCQPGLPPLTECRAAYGS